MSLATKYSPNKLVGEKNIGPVIVDYAGYRSTKQQIQDLFTAGRRLHAGKGYDGLDIEDDVDLSVSYYGSDGAENHRVAQELREKRSASQKRPENSNSSATPQPDPLPVDNHSTGEPAPSEGA